MSLPIRRVLLGLLLTGLAALVTSTARPAAEEPARLAATRIVYIGNDFAVENGPSAPSTFTTAAAWHIVEISDLPLEQREGIVPGHDRYQGTRHREDVRALRGVRGERARRRAERVLASPPRASTFRRAATSSSTRTPSTWAQNAESDHRGMAWIMATPAKACTPSRVLPPPGAARPATPAQDCSPPRVNAFPYPGFVSPVKPGKPAEPNRITLKWSVKDDSGHAKARVTLFEGGQYIRNAGYDGKATGKKLSWTVPLGAKLKGPLFFCVWAKDAAGNKSAGAPRSSCAWIKLVVPIGRVSNGCGGEGWDAVVAVENYFGNTSTYYGEDGTPYTVDFTAACNLHDAGYGGQTVHDEINKINIDYHDWSRGEIDEKFRMDMEKLCDAQIPAEERQALAECKTNFRYPTVRTVGNLFFDADPMTAGTQKTGDREQRLTTRSAVPSL